MKNSRGAGSLGVTLTVRVQPGARRSELSGYSGGVLRVRIAAPPVEGKANAALLAFLAERLGLRAQRLTIIRGFHARTKVVAVQGLTEQDVAARLGLTGQ